MPQILPRDLPPVPGGVLNPNSAIVADDGSGVFRPTPAQIADAGAPISSQAEAEAGAVNTGRMSPLRVKQAIDALGVSQDVLAAPTGGEMVGFSQTGANAIETDVLVKARQNVADRDFTTGLVGALTAVRNNDDTSFSGGVSIPNGITDISAPIALPQTFARVSGNGGGTYRQLDAEPIFDGSAASHVGNSFDNFRTYNGTHVFDISTVGEIASNTYNRLSLVAFTGDAFRFAGGVTSCLFANCAIDATNGDHGIYSGGGINNDNVVQNMDFTNLTKPAIKFLNLAQGLWVNYCRVEGNGQTGEAVFDLVGASGVRINGGWYEGHHDHLLKLSGSSSGGVTIDGIVDIGAKNGGGFKASTFDVGSNLVIFGTNVWSLLTTAPLNCLVYGLNDNLILSSSNVWEHKSHRGGKVHLRQRNTAVDTATFNLLTFTRATASPDALTNLQTLSGVLTLTYSGLNGVTAGRTVKYPVLLNGIGAAFNLAVGSAYAAVDTGAGGITLTPSEAPGGTSTSKTLRITVAGNTPGQDLVDASFDYDLNSNLATNLITVAAA